MKTTQNTAPVHYQFEDFVRYSEIKQLADNIVISQKKNGFRSLAVLSFFPGEGKTLFCATMALSYAESYQSSVLVADTTTFKGPRSLILKQCIPPNHPRIEFISLQDYRKNSNGNGAPTKTAATPLNHHIQGPALETQVVKSNASISLLLKNKSDQSLIQHLGTEQAMQYGLILIDTAPLTAKNKDNIDPLLVARMADASVLVVSPRFLNASDIESYMKVLADPTLHLIGIISNEEFLR